MADDKKNKGADAKKGAGDKGGAKGPGGAKPAAKRRRSWQGEEAGGGGPTRCLRRTVVWRRRSRLRDKYRNEVVPALMKQFNYSNPMQVPRVTKVTVNMGFGEAVSNGKIIEMGVGQVQAITGQKAVITRARKSIATFKLRRRPGHRRDGHPPPGADVGVPRPALHVRAAPRA